MDDWYAGSVGTSITSEKIVYNQEQRYYCATGRRVGVKSEMLAPSPTSRHFTLSILAKRCDNSLIAEGMI
jgi:hypothetical protein